MFHRFLFTILLIVFSSLILSAESDNTTSVESNIGSYEYNFSSEYLIRGTIRISPRGQSMTAANPSVTISGQPAAGWTQNTPTWQSTQVNDGWHDSTLQENQVFSKSRLLIINSPDVIIHDRALENNETWAADIIHIIKYPILIPENKTLTIQENAVVKFLDNTGFHVAGTLNAQNVHLFSIHDDIAGDTDMNGMEGQAGKGKWTITGTGTINVVKNGTAMFDSDYGTLDLRSDFGGRLARGTVRLSPTASSPDNSASLTIDQTTPDDWSRENPFWNSTAVNDGWHDSALSEKPESATARLAVQNNPQIMVHGGILSSNETWTADKIHVIRYWLRIPASYILTIPPGTIVKFCSDTGFIVEGTLNAPRTILTTVDDDTAGGDTDLDGTLTAGKDFQITGNGSIDLTDAEIRRPLNQNITWNTDQVHVIKDTILVSPGLTLTIAPGTIVKFTPGSALICTDGGTVICSGAVFTHLADDEKGGDTNQDGNASSPIYNDYKISGFVPGDDCTIRYLDTIAAGWTLFTLPYPLQDTQKNQEILHHFNAYAAGNRCFHRPSLPLPAGTSLWLQSDSFQSSGFQYEQPVLSETPSPTLRYGWNMTGISGVQTTILPAANTDSIWKWDLKKFQKLSPDSEGNYLLTPGIGYFIHSAE